MRFSNKTISIYLFILFAIGISILNSCKKDEVVTGSIENCYDYYRVDSGYWIEYVADSIVHFDSDDYLFIDTDKVVYHFYIREQVDSSFIDGEGETAYVVSRYRRTADSLPWTFTALWTSKLNSTSLERVEDNRRYLRLSFPFNTISKWNGNAFNELPYEEYTYEEIYSPAYYSSLTFDSTITVNQNEFVSNINRIIRKEIYGSHVGLLFKQADSIGVAYTSGGIVILSGVEFSQTVIDYKH